MSPMPCPRAGKLIRIVCCAVLLGLATAAKADPKPLSKQEQARVDKAIEKGITYLKRTQGDEGNWSNGGKNHSWSLGECLLAAYALLEADVPTDDPVIRKAAAYSRAQLLKTDKTYELALGVLFLDRLGETTDEALLRSLALRLIAGQQRSGGWKYLCPRVKQEEEETLLEALGTVNKLAEKGEKRSAKSLKDLNVPAAFRTLTIFHTWAIATRDPVILPQKQPNAEQMFAFYNSGGTDNSNTQFAMLALWTARRHKLPLRPTLDLLVLRFKYSQGSAGAWKYRYETTGSAPPGSSNRVTGEWRSMTCVGLLALAIGRERQGASAESPPAKLAAKGKDINILRGLAYLYRCVGTPTGQMEDPIALPFGDYYYLWSLERVAMLYNLPTLADKEWYRWGAEILVTNQDSNGSFVGGTQWWKEPLALNTAFALLFLKHSHPMKDLTPRLPFKPEALNESVARLVPKGKVPDRSTASPGQRRDLDRSTTSPGKIPNPGR